MRVGNKILDPEEKRFDNALACAYLFFFQKSSCVPFTPRIFEGISAVVGVWRPHLKLK